MDRFYYVVFTLLGAGYGVVVYVAGRQAMVNVVDTTALVPNYPYVTVIVNVAGLFLAACLLVVVVAKTVQWLDVHNM